MIPKSIQNLSARQWIWLCEAYWRLLLAQWRIKFKQQNWLRSKIDLADAQPATRELDLAEMSTPERMFESVRVAARLMPLATACLPRSIVLSDMLSWRGFDAKAVIGVSKSELGLASHAWVEVGGQIVSEPESVSIDFSRISKE